MYKIDTSTKALLANFALLIRFLSDVGSDMHDENSLLCKAFLTNFTLIRFLSSVVSDQ